MDAIIGRYRVRMEETGLVLTHSSGMSFDLTAGETLDLLGFISIYRKALLIRERETDPEIERIVEKETDAIKESTPES